MLNQLRYFQSVVRSNSFTAAAEECHISQSAISQQIKALEAELGTQLIKRHGRSFELTPAGERFYKKSLLIVADYDRLCQEITSTSYNIVTVKGTAASRVFCRLKAEAVE